MEVLRETEIKTKTRCGDIKESHKFQVGLLRILTPNINESTVRTLDAYIKLRPYPERG